jgi:hypothetical protein
MTVSELIKVLTTCPQNLEVSILSGYEDFCFSGGEVEHIVQTKPEHGQSCIVFINESDGPVLHRLGNYTVIK